MALTHASTLSDAFDQYLDNLAWEGNVAKARAALEAIRYLQARRPLIHRAADGRGSDYESMAHQQQEIEAYLSIADTTTRPRCNFTRAQPINSV